MLGEILWYVFLALAGLLFIGNLFTGPLQHLFIFRPRRLPRDFSYQFLEVATELFIETSHGGEMNALWFKGDQQLSPKGVILFFHGNRDNLSRWGHLYHFFTRFGYDFFVYDYRGYGKSTGQRNQKFLYQDAQEMYEYLRQFYPPERIVLYGRSLGSAFAARVGAKAPAKLLVLETPFFNMRELFYTYYPFLPRLFFFRYSLPTQRYLKEVQCPVHIFQGTKDLIVPFSCAVKLKACLKPGDAFHTVTGAGHNNLLFYDLYNLKMLEILQ